MSLPFLTPLVFNDPKKSFGSYFLEKVDNYFYLGGKKAYVLRAKNGLERVVLTDGHSSLLGKIAKVMSYFTVVIPMGMLLIKTVLRSTHRFKVIDPKKKLEKGIDVSSDIGKIQQLADKIILGKDDGEIQWLSKGNNHVFQLAQNPSLVFKISRQTAYSNDGKLPYGGNKAVLSRFNNMIKAKEVCLAHELDKLVVPHAKSFEITVDGKQYVFIAEKRLNCNPEESAQEENYHAHAAELDKAIRQLAVFIAKTGFSDVTWRNIPMIGELSNFQGDRRIALIDLEDMKDKVRGFLGGLNRSQGLIGCVSKAQIDMVIELAKNLGITPTYKSFFDSAKQSRLEVLQGDKKRRRWHKEHGIVTGEEPIQITPQALGLDLTEQTEAIFVEVDEDDNPVFIKRTVTLGKAVEDVIAEIYKCLQEASSKKQASIKGKRRFLLDTNSFPLYSYRHIPRGISVFDPGAQAQLWFPRIIQALIDNGMIFKMEQDRINGYVLQA